MSNEYKEEKVLIEKQIQGLSGINNAAALILIEKYKNILKAVEKQVPKKPIARQTGSNKFHCCPNCKEFISLNDLFCSYCGQRLEW